MRQKPIQVFVSSTYGDPRSGRQLATASRRSHPASRPRACRNGALRRGSASQLETIKRWIDGCEAYCVIVGTRCGSIEPGSGKNYVEVEYDYAAEQGKKFLRWSWMRLREKRRSPI